MRIRTLIAVALVALLSGGLGYYTATVRAADETTHYQRDEGDMDLTRDDLLDQIRVVTEKYKEIAQAVDPANENDDTRKAREEQINKIMEPLQLDMYALLLQAHLLSIDTIVDKGGAPTEAFIRDKLLIEGLGATKEDVAKYQKQADVGYAGLIIGYAIAKAGKIQVSEVFARKADSAQSWLRVMNKHNVVAADIFNVLETAFQ